MTFLAILTKLVVVHIFVTSVAIGVSQILETLLGNSIHHFFLVTLLTSQCLMFAQQREMRLAVVKGFRVFETVKTVAFRTIGGHLALVVIVVAGQASLV